MENKFKDAINKMKVIVSEIFAKTEDEVQEELALVAVKAEDGTLLQIPEEGIVVDTEITVINEDGTITPAPNGEYIVDGKIIVIVDGKVTEIKEVEIEETEEVVEEEMSTETKDENFVEEENIEDATADADMEEIKAAVNEMVNMMNQIIEFVSVLDKRIADIEKKSEMEKQFSKTIEKRITELESLPLSESIKKNKNKTNVEEIEDKYIMKLRNLRK